MTALVIEDNFSNLNTKIIKILDINFLINIIYGGIFSIISNNQLLNNKTFQLEVTIDLGKEMISKYILGLYRKVKEFNPNLTYINWKQENQELIQETEGNQFQFELGNVLFNFMVDLKFIKAEAKVLPSSIGLFNLYRKVSGLYSGFLLKQEENFIKDKIKFKSDKNYIKQLKDLQKININYK